MADNSDVCVICCYKSDYFCVGQCDHRVCFECGTRLRVLCQLNECSICRSQMPFVYVINGCDKTFSSIDGRKFLEKDIGKQYGFKFENEEAYSAVVDLLAHVCTICKEEPEFRSFDNLSQHMRRKHELFYCDLCVEHLKLFSWERKCYNRTELAQHRRTGDQDDRSHKGHPLCEFCDERYLDNDFLYRHLRRDHFFCHFCDADGKTNIYYPDPEKLKDHFKTEHYLCQIGNCKNEHLGISFRHEVDFKAHKGNVHGRDIQKGELKKELQVNINFNYGPTSARERFAKQNNDRQVRNFPSSDQRCGNVSSGPIRQYADIRNQKPNHPAAGATANLRTVNSDAQVTAPLLSTPAVDENFDLKREDFPTLLNRGGGAIAKSRKPPTSQHDNHVISNQQQTPRPLSKIIGKSGRSGSLGENDFPALNDQGGRNERKNQNSKDKQSGRFRRDSLSVSPKHNRKVPPSGGGFRMVDDDEDFPSCSSPTTAAAVPANQNEATTESNVAKPDDSSKTRPTRPNWGPPRLTANDVIEADFPALPTKSSKKAKSSANRNVSNNSSSKTTGWAQKVQSQPQPKIAVELPAKPKLDRKEFPALVSLPKTKARARLVAQNKQRPSVDEQDCDNVKAPKKVGKMPDEKSSSPKIDDVIVTETGCYMGPPGFETSSKEKRRSDNGDFAAQGFEPPPGLSSSTKMAPPGFEPSSSATIPNGHAAGPVTVATGYSYIKPKTFQRRNRELFDFLSENLLIDNLNEFKMLSSLYKNGELTSDFYYVNVKSLLGDKLFRKCFTELICLLPDVSKQNGLLRAHLIHSEQQDEPARTSRRSAADGGVPWKKDFVTDFIRTCQMCKQITSVEDYAEHCSSHSSTADDEYPALY